ncbi:MAG: T9SS C-terminal target domain-containing protein [Bacteroidetes bacterium]|nr:MAG: T9SS C-terminal target domain-containing protein [Bacteroidota bacterium]
MGERSGYICAENFLHFLPQKIFKQMKTKLLLTFLFTSLFINCTFGQGDFNIKALSNGDYCVFGFFAGELNFNNGDTIGDYYSTDEGYFLAMFDSLGTTKWVKHLKTKSLNCWGHCPGTGLEVDLQDNILISGHFYDTLWMDNLNYVEPEGVFVAKYDNDGNFIWVKEAYISNGMAVDLDTDSLGNVYSAGIYSGGSLYFEGLPLLPGSNLTRRLFVVKFDADGNGEWIVPIRGFTTSSNNLYLSLYGLEVDRKGGVYITGVFGGESGYMKFGDLLQWTTSGSSYETFLAKCDSSGIPEWLTKINCANTCYPSKMSMDTSDNLFLSGFYRGSATFDTLPPITVNNQDMDVFLARYDTLGHAVWVRSGAFGDEYHLNGIGAMAADDMGNTYLTGVSGAGAIEFEPLPVVEESGAFFVKHDINGEAICQIIPFWAMVDIDATTEGNLYSITGSFDLPPGSYEPQYAHIFKWDDNCNLLWESTIEQNFEPIIWSTENINSNNGMEVFPNPSSGNFTVKWKENFTETAQMLVFDQLGKLITSVQIPSGINVMQLELRGQLPGIYFLKVTTKNRTYLQKIIKE